MNILIAGSGGFIGKRLFDKLTGLGHFVFGVDSFITSDIIKNDLIDYLDITDINQLAKVFRVRPKPDIIINLAGIPFPRLYKEMTLATLDTSYIGTKNLLDYAKVCGSKFIQASSSEVYGEGRLFNENSLCKTKPNHLRAAYIDGKRISESLCSAYEYSFGIKTLSLRFFNVYGPGFSNKDTRVIPSFIRKCLANEICDVVDSYRSYCYIDDCIDAITLSMFSEHSFKVLNIGTDDLHSTYSVFEIIKAATLSSSDKCIKKLDDGEPMIRSADNSRLRSLGWSPTIDFQTGLNLTIGYYNKKKEETSGY